MMGKYKIDKTMRFATEVDNKNPNYRKFLVFFKWLLYALLAFVFYAVMTTPLLLQIGEAKPLLLIPLCISVALFEEEIAGGVFSIFVGLIWTSGSNLPWGIDSFLLYISAVIAAVCTRYYFKITILSAFLFSLMASAIYLTSSFYISYGMYGYPGADRVLYAVYLPSMLYTLALTIPVFLLVRVIHVFVWERSNDRKWTN